MLEFRQMPATLHVGGGAVRERGPQLPCAAAQGAQRGLADPRIWVRITTMITFALVIGLVVGASFTWIDGLNSALAAIVAADCLVRQATPAAPEA
jgi:hypothetical protein